MYERVKGRAYQDGYPPHDREMTVGIAVVDRKGSAKKGSCGRPMVLPPQAGVEAGAHHLWCTGCSTLLVADINEIALARRMAEAEGFKPLVAVVRPLVAVVRPLVAVVRPARRVNRSEVTLPMFNGFEPRLRPNGTAR